MRAVACRIFRSLREVMIFLHEEHPEEPDHIYITKNYGRAEYRTHTVIWTEDPETGLFYVHISGVPPEGVECMGEN